MQCGLLLSCGLARHAFRFLYLAPAAIQTNSLIYPDA